MASNERRDFFSDAMQDADIRAQVEREWLADEIVLLLEQKMKDQAITRSKLAERLGCSPANVTQLLRKGTNLTIGKLVDLALALDHRFLAPVLVPTATTAPWHATSIRVLRPSSAWVRIPNNKTHSEAVSASSSVAWAYNAPEKEAEMRPNANLAIWHMDDGSQQGDYEY